MLVKEIKILKVTAKLNIMLTVTYVVDSRINQ